MNASLDGSSAGGSYFLLGTMLKVYIDISDVTPDLSDACSSFLDVLDSGHNIVGCPEIVTAGLPFLDFLEFSCSLPKQRCRTEKDIPAFSRYNPLPTASERFTLEG